jgi:hypothetical protein
MQNRANGSAREITSRRDVLRAWAGSSFMVALPASMMAWPVSPASASWLGSALGSIGGFFVGSAKVLSGWTVVDLLNTGNEAIHKAIDIENHVDRVLTQVSSSLTIIRDFVQDCDKALKDIETLVKQLPQALASGFQSGLARAALGKLEGECANMASYLASRGSIRTDASRIQDLCEKIVESISTLNALEINGFQFVMQTIPSITTWMHGYTSYNLLRKPEDRGTNPWDHHIVSGIVLPNTQKVIADCRSQQTVFADIEAHLPVKNGVLYQFDGNRFNQSSVAFKWSYRSGEIDNGYYYCRCPPNASPPGKYNKYRTKPSRDAISYLVQDNEGLGYRFWAGTPALGGVARSSLLGVASGSAYDSDILGWSARDPKAADVRAYTDARIAALLQERAAYTKINPFRKFMDGFDIFTRAVDDQLAKGDRSKWATIPQMPS